MNPSESIEPYNEIKFSYFDLQAYGDRIAGYWSLLNFYSPSSNYLLAPTVLVVALFSELSGELSDRGDMALSVKASSVPF